MATMKRRTIRMLVKIANTIPLVFFALMFASIGIEVFNSTLQQFTGVFAVLCAMSVFIAVQTMRGRI